MGAKMKPQAFMAAAFAYGTLGCAPSSPELCASVASPLTLCPAGAITRGIDVSVYQGTVDWTAVATSGVAFAFARVSDGIAFPDTQFAVNWTRIRAAGLSRGAYQFFRASEDPVAQANLVLSALSEGDGLSPADLPVVMDVETSDGQSSDEVRTHMAVWLEAVAAGTGRRPIVYTNVATAAAIGTGFSGYPLWVASWQATCPSLPAGWSSWAIWQYASTGAVAGIEGDVDLDELDGTLDDLPALGLGAHLDEGGSGDAGSTTMNVADGGEPPEDGAVPSPRSVDADAGAAMGGSTNGTSQGRGTCAP
jgi:lysozyme